jgi:hypothetical protein
MRNSLLLCFTIAVLLSSCNDYNPLPPYVYESNPHYTVGYAEFYGAYYAEYGNPNNSLSVSLFSDSVKINENRELVGFGQYLFLEDVFVSPTDTLLSAGVYTVDDSGKPFTVFKGINDTINGDIYHSGAYINYFEKTAAKSTVKLITSGTFSVVVIDAVYSITFDLKTSDNQELKGSFATQLIHVDRSIEAKKSKIRKGPALMWE